MSHLSATVAIELDGFPRPKVITVRKDSDAGDDTDRGTERGLWNQSGPRSSAVNLVQEMHRKAADTQVLIRARRVGYVAVSGVALFVSETINCHSQELDTILKIAIDMRSRSALDVESAPSEGLRSGFIAAKDPEPVSDHLEAILNSFTVISTLIQLPTPVEGPRSRCSRRSPATPFVSMRRATPSTSARYVTARSTLLPFCW